LVLTTADPHIYTAGRWLNHDNLHRDARRVEFDFAALCAKAVNTCTGATKVVQHEKKEGGFNRVFLLSLDNGARVVARVPFRIAGPRGLTTNSEVATMVYGKRLICINSGSSAYILKCDRLQRYLSPRSLIGATTKPPSALNTL
jgi:hypothetical protein